MTDLQWFVLILALACAAIGGFLVAVALNVDAL